MPLDPASLRTTVYKIGQITEADGSPSPYGAPGQRQNNTPLAGDGSGRRPNDENTHFLLPANQALSYVLRPQNGVTFLDFAPAGAGNKIVYLPYYQNNITSAVIPAGDATVNRFITDEMSGCNLFIDRLPSNDLVLYHANALKYSPTMAEVQADAGAYNAMAPVMMDNQHGRASRAYRGAVNLTVLRVADYYGQAQAAVDRKVNQGRTEVEFYGGTTIVGFRIGGGWEFWFQTYARLAYKRPKLSFATLRHGQRVTPNDARYRIIEARRFYP